VIVGTNGISALVTPRKKQGGKITPWSGGRTLNHDLEDGPCDVARIVKGKLIDYFERAVARSQLVCESNARRDFDVFGKPSYDFAKSPNLILNIGQQSKRPSRATMLEDSFRPFRGIPHLPGPPETTLVQPSDQLNLT
jgi:hypothetical protein